MLKSTNILNPMNTKLTCSQNSKRTTATHKHMVLFSSALIQEVELKQTTYLRIYNSIRA